MNTQEDWFFLANDDLSVAEHMVQTMHPVPRQIVCFLCQQAAEKYLKGYLSTKMTDEPPYTHDLVLLINMCGKHDAGFNAVRAACAALTSYASKTRYDRGLYPAEDDMKTALAHARQIRGCVLERADAPPTAP